MKKVILSLVLSYSLFGFSQTNKQNWTRAQLIDPQGQTIHKWDAKSFTQFIIPTTDQPCMEVCSRRFLIVSSNDSKVLQMISPSSVFDVSPTRSFEQFGSIEKADSDSVDVVYKLEFKSINYPDRILMFTDSITSFIMLMSTKNVALVLYNDSK